ncbi:hypothetical protein BJY59DRAFT_209032 [Rhodotorula toruloides]
MRSSHASPTACGVGWAVSRGAQGHAPHRAHPRQAAASRCRQQNTASFDPALLQEQHVDSRNKQTSSPAAAGASCAGLRCVLLDARVRAPAASKARLDASDHLIALDPFDPPALACRGPLEDHRLRRAYQTSLRGAPTSSPCSWRTFSPSTVAAAFGWTLSHSCRYACLSIVNKRSSRLRPAR